MRKTRKGFTLIELVVVTVILGIMASMAIPFYLKSVESSKASDAVAIGHMLANSYRMFKVDNPGVGLSGMIKSAPDSPDCNTGLCSTIDNTGCRLVRCNYVARQSWSMSAYNFTIKTGSPGSPVIVTVTRKNGASPGTNTAAYTGWGYNFSDLSGGVAGCAPLGTTPPCPNF